MCGLPAADRWPTWRTQGIGYSGVARREAYGIAEGGPPFSGTAQRNTSLRRRCMGTCNQPQDTGCHAAAHDGCVAAVPYCYARIRRWRKCPCGCSRLRRCWGGRSCGCTRSARWGRILQVEWCNSGRLTPYFMLKIRKVGPEPHAVCDMARWLTNLAVERYRYSSLLTPTWVV